MLFTYAPYQLTYWERVVDIRFFGDNANAEEWNLLVHGESDVIVSARNYFVSKKLFIYVIKVVGRFGVDGICIDCNIDIRQFS